MSYFFTTGTYRSGTTLLQKILAVHKDIFSVEQPFPTLFILLKKRFLAIKGVNQTIPLNHLLGQSLYTVDDFTNFLTYYKITDKDIDEAIERAKTFNGVKTKEILEIDKKLISDVHLNSFYGNYTEELSKLSKKTQAKVKGSKEIVAEEYIPYFLRNSIKTILIIRDIRDVINSANFGKGSEFIGNKRPTLFTIRQWRKSVAFAIQYQDHPNFFFVKYENLVLNTEKTLAQIFNFLGVQSNNIKQKLKNFHNTWTANSSFENYKTISNKSVGRYKKNLSEEHIKYIEYLTYPELLVTGYKPDFVDKKYFVNPLNNQFLSQFCEPIPVSHKAFPKNYSTDKKNLSNEINRIKVLTTNTPIDSNSIRRLFIFKKAYNFLKLKLNEQT